jgi:hypothetical protein
MLTRTKLLIVTAALLASVSAVSASEPLESTINGRYAPVIGAERNALAAYAQDRGPVRDFATRENPGASFERDSMRDHAKGSVPN